MRLLLSALAVSIPAQTLASEPPVITAADIEGAIFTGDPVPDGQSALAARLQILLDRAGVSPGVIDGYKGDMSASALMGFEARAGLAVDGVLDAEVWAALGGDTATGLTRPYTITAEDASGLVGSIPGNVRDKAAMTTLGYTSVAEALGERFHMDEDFLAQLNPSAAFLPGEIIHVADPGAPLDMEVTRIEIRKADRRAVAFAADGTVIANYPVAIGSAQTPSPEGTVEVLAVAIDPTYSYNPEVNFEADGVKEALTLPPGPNGPVGSVWIDLSKPTYGLHGTDTPAALFKNESHGCVRFTNWDVDELAHMVRTGATVEFIQ